MKNILFCPPIQLGNTLQERYAEQAIAEAFEGKVQSLVLHQGETDEELFDLICDSDLVVVMTMGENSVTERTYKVITVALQMNKPTYWVKQKENK